MDSATARERGRAARQAVDPALQRSRANELASVSAAALFPFVGQGDDLTSKVLAGYVATDGELDPSATLSHAARLGATIAFPVVGQRSTMRFVAVDAATRWGTNRFGIAEPESGAEIGVADLDAVLVPCTAVDRSGHRVGRGAGYYDRAFTGTPGRAFGPILVAVAHAEQVMTAIAVTPHDVVMDAVATPEGFHWTGRSRR
ncbi:MAG: 5-formyltetrahydrofolate cyclo-ligase [Microthrixaceae bacterium]